MKKGLNEWAQDIHQNAVDHGWWENNRELPEVLMLCVSELSEALEEYRDGNPPVYCGSTSKVCETARGTTIVEIDEKKYTTPCATCCSENKKPEGVAVEMADCLIRILDYAGRMGWDIESIVQEKHEYNKSRPYRHGGKKC